VSLTLGVESEDIYNEFQPLLVTCIKYFEDGTSSKVRNEAITALATVCFVGCNDELATREHLALLESIFESDIHSLHTNAIKAWTMLLTTLSPIYISTKVFPRNIKILASLLNSVDVSTRIAAGESIAYLFDVLRQAKEERDETFDLYSYGSHVDIDEMLEKLKELSYSANRQCNKKDRNKQKSYFKDIVHSLEEGTAPEEELSICDQKISFETWKQLIQLNFIRERLAEGTQEHLENNELLYQIFEYELTKGAVKQSLSRVEKRLFMSPNSGLAKARSKARNVDRDNFGRRGGGLFGGEEEPGS